jgi:hypothetical protein
MRSAASVSSSLGMNCGGVGLVELGGAGSGAIGRDQDHPRSPRQLGQLARESHAIAVGQRHVEQDKSRPDLVDHLPGPLDGVRLAGDTETRALEQLHREAAEPRVIVDDEDIRCHGADDRNRRIGVR